MLAMLEVPLGRLTVGLFKHEIKLLLPFMSLQAATILGTGTLPLELTLIAGLRRSLVFIVLPTFVVVPSVQYLPGWTQKSIRLRVIGEILFGENAFLFS
jgi:hypothetical protein